MAIDVSFSPAFEVEKGPIQHISDHTLFTIGTPSKAEEVIG